MPNIMVDTVQVAADDTDVFTGRLSAVVPTWAKWVEFWLVSSDSDWTYSASVGTREVQRSSGPNATGADNIQGSIFDSGGCSKHEAVSGERVLVNVDVVTAGVGTMSVRYSGS